MQNDFIKLTLSILAADFAHLEQVAEAERAGADRTDVDVMDGHFVSNIAIAPIAQSLHRVTHLPMEKHLMISDPDFLGTSLPRPTLVIPRALGRQQQFAPHSATY